MQKFIWGLLFAVALGAGATIAQQTSPAAVNGGIYNSTPPTLSNLQRGVFQLDVNGNLKTTSSGGTLPTGASTAANQTTQITAANTTNTNLGAPADAACSTDNGTCSQTALLKRIAQNLTTLTQQTTAFLFANITTATTTTVKSGAGILHCATVNSLGTIASTTEIYDNTAGTGTLIGVIDTLTQSGTFCFDVAFATGLTLVTTGTVAPNVTVSYR